MLCETFYLENKALIQTEEESNILRNIFFL